MNEDKQAVKGQQTDGAACSMTNTVNTALNKAALTAENWLHTHSETLAQWKHTKRTNRPGVMQQIWFLHTILDF